MSTSRYAGGTLAGARSAGSLVRGTLANVRLPRSITVGTISGLYSAGSLNRGTIPAAQMQTLPNTPGTLSIVTKTSGTLSIATRALGTLANQRLSRSISVGTISAKLSSGSLNRGTMGIGRGQSMLGSVIKGNVMHVGFSQNIPANTTSRIWKGVVPSGKVLRVWAMGITALSTGSGISTNATGSLYAAVFSISASTYYRRVAGTPSSHSWLTGSPLVKVPAGTAVSFNQVNQYNVAKAIDTFWLATLE